MLYRFKIIGGRWHVRTKGLRDFTPLQEAKQEDKTAFCKYLRAVRNYESETLKDLQNA